MIVFDLHCDNGHAFEGWFRSTEDFAGQQERGLLSCPDCGTASVAKAPMAPAVPRKGNSGAPRQAVEEIATPEDRPVANRPMPAELQRALKTLARAQAKALEKSRWVGNGFAEQSRAMHYGEREAEPIHGEASMDEAARLIDEGIEVSPLPFPVAPPEDLN